MSEKTFWEAKNLFEMTKKEWESLCDGCGQCCLSKVEDEDTGEIYQTNIHCRLYNPKSCQCTRYKKRKQFVADCVVLTPKKVHKIKWLPNTCAYRLLAEGRPLYSWHPLISGNPNSVHKAGISTKNRRTISEESIKDLRDHVTSPIDFQL